MQFIQKVPKNVIPSSKAIVQCVCGRVVATARAILFPWWTDTENGRPAGVE